MRTLQTLDIVRNPIEFPPKKAWSLDPNAEDDRNSVRADTAANRLLRTQETKIIVKLLRDEIQRRKTQKEGTDGEQRYETLHRSRAPTDLASESNAETPRPTRRRTTGRPPIRPSVSAITVESISSSRPASPLPPRLPVAKSYMALQTQPISTAIRPGVAPLVNNNNERNRSNSESVMQTTTRRDKRKGFFNRDHQLSRELMSERDPSLQRQNPYTHFKGLSLSGVPNGDLSDQTTPVDGETLRPSFVQRLSSLPEDKRKSRVDNPSIEFARGISYSLQQVIKPLEVVLVGGSPKGPMGRTWTNAYQFLEELHKQISHAERQGEYDEEYDRHKSESLINRSCSNCIQAFIHLCVTLQGHIRTIAGQTNPRHVRTLMHMLYASLVEVQNACKRLGGPELKIFEAAQHGRDHYRKTSRVLSPGPDRPVTSLRNREQQRHIPMSSTSSYGFKQYNQFSMSSPGKSGSTAGYTPMTPYSINSFTSQVRSRAPSTRSNSNAIVRSEDRLDDSEERQLEIILMKLDLACDLALQDLPPCNQILMASRIALADRRGVDLEANLYGTAYEGGRAFTRVADTLKARLQTVKIHERQSRNQVDFWQLCREFTMLYILFTGQIRDICVARVGPEGDEVKIRLKSLFRTVKEVSRNINESPWRTLAVPSGQQPIIPLPTPQTSFSSSNGHSRNMPSRHHGYSHGHMTESPLSLQTWGTMPPIPTSDPQSAVSNASSGGVVSGHVTPLPATPMSAALGHAALATVPGHPVPLHVPAMTDLSEGAVTAAYHANINGAHPTTSIAFERARSISQRRV